MFLRQQLTATRQITWGRMGLDERRRCEAAIAELRRAGVIDEAVSTGEMVPDFVLPIADGTLVALTDQLDCGPLVIVFVPSAICPLSRRTLEAYADALPALRQKGARLIAISIDLSARDAEEVSLPADFPWLNDSRGHVSALFGLLYPVPGEVAALLPYIGIPIRPDEHGVARASLVATYLVGQDGLAAFAAVDVDPACRAEPADVLAAVDALCQPPDAARR